MSMLRYDYSKTGITQNELGFIVSELEDARAETLDDIELRESPCLPDSRKPCDSAFIEMPKRLLDAYRKEGEASELGQILATAKMLREQTDRVVLLGIGGSYMGAKALFNALCSPFHNELSREERHGTPRIYFEGENLDGGVAAELLAMIENSQEDWCCVPISKSGGTTETAVATRIFLNAARKRYGDGSEKLQKFFVPVTGKTGSKLRKLGEAVGVQTMFEVPDGVGGRFSVLSAVGLLPAAIMGVDVVQLLEGAAAMTERFQNADIFENPVLCYVGVNYLLETRRDMDVRILSTWGKRLEYCGLWLDQLEAESLGKDFAGALPLTCVNTRDLHSRGQQHQQGKTDKTITNLFELPTALVNPLSVSVSDRDEDELNMYSGKSYPELLDAARRGTNEAYSEVLRPTADMSLEKICAYSLGEFFQLMMLATAVEGRLIGINPYGQPGVEAYKKNMKRILKS